MRTFLLFSFLMILITQFGCQQPNEIKPKQASPNILVSLQIESQFQNDSVKLALDGRTLLQSRVTTNPTVTLAWGSELLKLSRDNHLLSFEVIDFGAQSFYKIDTSNDTSTVNIDFHRNTNQITFRQVKGIVKRR